MTTPNPATPAELRRLAAELRQYQHVGPDALTAVPTDSSATGMTGTVHIRPAANDTAVSRAAAALSAAADTIERLERVPEAVATARIERAAIILGTDDTRVTFVLPTTRFSVLVAAQLAAASDTRVGEER